MKRAATGVKSAMKKYDVIVIGAGDVGLGIAFKAVAGASRQPLSIRKCRGPALITVVFLLKR
jgi:thioredoxin reductase